MNVEVDVGVGVGGSVEVNVGVNEGVLVGVEDLVGLKVGVLNQPPFLFVKEMMKTPRMINRIAKMPIMVLDLIRTSYGFTARSAFRYRVHGQWR